MGTLLTDLRELFFSFQCIDCSMGLKRNCDNLCYKHRLEFEAVELEKKGWVNPIRCKDCHNWLRIKNNKKIGSHYCDVDLQAYGVMCNCPPTHFCSYGEPRDGTED